MSKSEQTKCPSCKIWCRFDGVCFNYTCRAYDRVKCDEQMENEKKRRADALAARDKEE